MKDTDRNKIAARITEKLLGNPFYDLDYTNDKQMADLVETYFCVVLMEIEMSECAKDLDMKAIKELRRSFQYKDTDYKRVYEKVVDMSDEFIKRKITEKILTKGYKI